MRARKRPIRRTIILRQRGEEPDECPRHSAHHPDLLHVVAQVDQPGFQHGERTDQAGIVKKEETDLFPDAPAGEEIDHICLFGPFVRFLRLDADAFVEKEWQKGGDDEQRDARQQTVPADLLEEQEQDTAPDHRTSETSHRLHAVCKAFIFPAESEYRNASVAISCVAEATKDMMIKATIV